MKRTALITGGSKGIGLELAKLHAKNGDDLILVARSEEKLEEIKNDLEEKFGIKVYIIIKDLSVISSSSELYEEIREKKLNVDYLINNAGFGNFGEFSETNWEKELSMINLNITALTHLTKLFLKDMLLKGSGKIMNVASTAAFQPGPRMAVYYASKAYVLHFTEAIAQEAGGTNISVTAFCPGATDTEFQEISKMKKTKLVSMIDLEDARPVAEYGYKSMMEGKKIAVPGILHKISSKAYRFLPRNIITKIVGMIQKED